MTPDERDRLVTLEANYKHAIDAIENLTVQLTNTNQQVADLVTALKTGQSTWRLLLALGTLVIGALGLMSGHLTIGVK
jgi:ABC-type bacteriocin/lantibiotic exporter with double-glycine peptidase domain